MLNFAGFGIHLGGYEKIWSELFKEVLISQINGTRKNKPARQRGIYFSADLIHLFILIHLRNKPIFSIP